MAEESHKHTANDQKLGWVCVPIAVQTYGNCGREAQDTLLCLASRLAGHWFFGGGPVWLFKRHRSDPGQSFPGHAMNNYAVYVW